MPKSPNITWTVLLIAVPLLTTFLTDLGKEGIVTSIVVDVGLLLLASLSKYLEEQKKQVEIDSADQEDLMVARSITPTGLIPSKPFWTRVLLE